MSKDRQGALERLVRTGGDMRDTFLRHVYGHGVTMEAPKHPSLIAVVTQWDAALAAVAREREASVWFDRAEKWERRAVTYSQEIAEQAREIERLRERANLNALDHAAAVDEIERLREALEPFKSGGEWGKWKAWLVEGTRVLDGESKRGLDAAQLITRWQVSVDAALRVTPEAS